MSISRQLTLYSNSCKNFPVAALPTVRPQDASSLVPLVALIKVLRTPMSSHGNVVLLARQLHGKSVRMGQEATTDVMLLLQLRLGPETVAAEPTTVVAMLITVVSPANRLLELLLRGSNQLRLSLERARPLLAMLVTLLLAMPVDTLLNKLWVLHLDLQLLLD
jgi:hypothetical protein